MGKLWPLMGPDDDFLWFDAVAKLFGYSADYLDEMILEGRFPAPRGEGKGRFYTGDDVAAIRLLLGRWRPQEKPGKTGEKGGKPGKTGEKEE